MASRPTSDKRDDATLVRACREGDASAWEALIRRYQRLIYSVPVNYRLPGQHADEVFQRVVVKLFEKLHQLKRIESLPAWLVTTARRECQTLVTKERRFAPAEAAPAPVEPPPDVAGALDAVQTEHLLARAFEELEDPCRSLLTALYLEDPTPAYHEIAARLGRPIGSLGPTRARCLAKLRAAFLRLGGKQP